MPMCNLLEYSNICFVTSGNLWNYYRDEVNDAANEIVAYYRINNMNITTSKYFEHKKKVTGSTSSDNSRLDRKVIVLLYYLINFSRSLDISLIDCEIDLHLSWAETSVITEVSRAPELPNNPAANPPTDNVLPTQGTGTTFQISSAKLYVRAFTLSNTDNIKFLKISSKFLNEQFLKIKINL